MFGKPESMRGVFHPWALIAWVLSGACAPSERKLAQVEVSTVPEVVYTVMEGVVTDPEASSESYASTTQDLSWLFHLVFHARAEEPLRFEEVEVSFKRGSQLICRELLPRDYLDGMEWIEGAYELSTEYFLDHVMFGQEKPSIPELPAGGKVTWIRIPFARPGFASIDSIDFLFRLRNPRGDLLSLSHSVPITNYRQKVELRLPFSGAWAVIKGNDVDSGHRRTGLHGLTTLGWDFAKVDGESYGEPVLAAGEGVVVDARNDIEDYGRGERLPRERFKQDGDVFAGNLVTIDHGNGEYSLTCHLQTGSVTVAVGDRISRGQVIGRVGKAGLIHFNLMDDGEWLEARALPGLFRDIERILPGGPPQKIDFANPRSGWLVRPVE